MLSSIEDAIKKLESYVEDPLVKPSDLVRILLAIAIGCIDIHDREPTSTRQSIPRLSMTGIFWYDSGSSIFQ